VLGVIDLVRLFNGAVVKPQDDIAVVAIVVEIRACHRDGLIGIGREDGQGAGGVEADALDLLRVNGSLDDDATNTLADALPDIGC
jgi:hypothetical protein